MHQQMHWAQQQQSNMELDEHNSNNWRKTPPETSLNRIALLILPYVELFPLKHNIFVKTFHLQKVKNIHLQDLKVKN